MLVEVDDVGRPPAGRPDRAANGRPVVPRHPSGRPSWATGPSWSTSSRVETDSRCSTPGSGPSSTGHQPTHPGMTSSPHPGIDRGRRLVIPAVFDGPDLRDVADALASRTGPWWPACAAWISTWPSWASRRDSPTWSACPPSWPRSPGGRHPGPRSRPGRWLVGGGFASVYPQPTPGGWMLLGRTSVALFDRTPSSLRPAPTGRRRALRRGDRPGRTASPSPGRASSGGSSAADEPRTTVHRGPGARTAEPRRGPGTARNGDAGCPRGRPGGPRRSAVGQSPDGQPRRCGGGRAHRVRPHPPLPR